MSRRDDLTREIDEHSRFLADTPVSDSVAARITRQQIEYRVDELRTELSLIETRPLVVHIEGAPVEDHAVSSGFLAYFLRRLQSALTWATWAIDAGPGVKGDVPARYKRMSATEVYAMAPGSFEFGLRQSEEGRAQPRMLDALSLYDKAVEDFVDLTEAASRGSMGEHEEEVIREFGPQASRRLNWLVKKFADVDAVVDLTLDAPEHQRKVRLEPDAAKFLAGWLSEREVEVETIEVRGVLRVLDTVRGRFGIEDDAENLYEGRAPRALLSGANVEGGYYLARIERETYTTEHTAESGEHYTLTALEAVADLS